MTVTRALPDRGGHVGPRRPRHVQPAARPSPPALYDRTTDPDVAVLPLLVETALSVLLRAHQAPGSVPRPQTLEACDIVSAHFSRRTDDCDPRGMPRPGLQVLQ